MMSREAGVGKRWVLLAVVVGSCVGLVRASQQPRMTIKNKIIKSVNCSYSRPWPLYLRQPLTHLFYLPADQHTQALLDRDWPIPDYKRESLEDMNTAEALSNRLAWQTILQQAYLVAQAKLWNMRKVEHMLMEKKVMLSTEDSAYKLQKLFKHSAQETLRLAVCAHMQNFVSLAVMYKIIAVEGGQGSEEMPFCPGLMVPPSVTRQSNTNPFPVPVCDPTARYRTLDGTCNNLANPLWGSPFRPFRRLLGPRYGDGLMSLRQAADGSRLPGARLVSVSLNATHPTAPSCHNLLHMTFGQFLDHDLTSTPTVQGEYGQPIPCCRPEVLQDSRLNHPECAPIPIPWNDPLYAPYGRTCMDFVRSTPAATDELGAREQVNQVTAYVDGSAVYGSTANMSAHLRTFSGGLLATQMGPDGEEMLPASNDMEDGCNNENAASDDRFCFRSGDHRVNEQMLLMLVTTVWARYHNLVARELARLNPAWDDERLFQEARRIVVAVMQKVTYNEFLPAVIGPHLMRELDLYPKQGGQYTKQYDPDINPDIANEFATAAFRFGHSMVPDFLQFLNESRGLNMKQSQELNRVLFNPFEAYTAGVGDSFMMGSLSQRVQPVDATFTQQVKGKLFKEKKQFGLDLVALNIQRARDHGIPGYTSMRAKCGLSPVTSFKDLAEIVGPEVAKVFQELYKFVEDVDLFPASMAEPPVAGGQVGATFACVIADQFLRLKRGDRFWFEEEEQNPYPFTTDQLREIQQMTMARVLCGTVRAVTSVQAWSLQVPTAYNPELACSSACIPRLNLTLWQE